MLSFQDAKNRFMRELLFRQYAPSTCRSYNEALKKLKTYLDQIEKQDLHALTPKDLFQYQRDIRSQSWAIGSQQGHFYKILSFFSYLEKQGCLLENPTKSLCAIRCVAPELPNILSVQEMTQLLSAPFDKHGLGLRDRAIIEILYSSGLRLNELVNLRIMHLDVHRGYLFVESGKGRKDRTIPVGKKATDATNDYLSKLRPKLNAQKKDPHILFLTMRGTQMESKVVRRLLGKYARLVGIERRIYPHLIRHTMASHLMNNGASMRVVQDILGHSQINTTQRYTHLNKEQLRQIYTKYHPRGEWLWIYKD